LSRQLYKESRFILCACVHKEIDNSISVCINLRFMSFDLIFKDKDIYKYDKIKINELYFMQ